MTEPNKQASAAQTGGAPKQEPARLIAPINADRMKLTEHNTAQFDIVLVAGTEPDDILPVAFWSHLAHTFEGAKKQGDVLLNVKTEDLKWRAQLEVVDAGKNWARVVFMSTEDGKRLITKLGGLQSHKVVFLPGHTVNYAGVFAKWRIVRDADGKVLSEKHNTEGDAYAWLSEYAKSIAA
jgi:hypothetical protein